MIVCEMSTNYLHCLLDHSLKMKTYFHTELKIATVVTPKLSYTYQY